MSGVVTVSRALTPRNWTATSDPTNAFDAGDGVRVGDHWFNTTSGNVFVCVDNTVGAAKWRFFPRALGATGAASALTGTTAETALATVTVPAGAMGANGVINIVAKWQISTSGNNKTARVRFSTISGTAFTAIVQTTNITIKTHTVIANRGATNSQIGDAGNGTGGWAPSAGADTTAAVDTTAATTIILSGQLANAGDTITLASYDAMLNRPDIT